jgi:hypothetical protein
MIKSYEMVKKQVFHRIKEKTQERAFINYIYQNTNLSQIEAQVVFEQFSDAFLNNDRHKLKEMQTIFVATKIDAPPGKALSETDYGEVVLTLHSKEDEEIREDPSRFSKKNKFGGIIDSTTAVRRNKLKRMAEEAYRQGCVLTQEDLAFKLLNCGIRTVQRDIREFKKVDVHIPIRGAVCDIGRSVSHKVAAVKGFVEGIGIASLARKLHHSVASVERYVNKFFQICSALQEGLKDPEISFLTRSSYSLINEYKELYEKLRKDNKLELVKDWLSRAKGRRCDTGSSLKKNEGRDTNGN